VLDGPSDAPASVIVKQVAFDHDVHARGLFYNEWAGLAFLGEVAGDAVAPPRLWGGEPGAGVLVMEDLDVGVSLHAVLLGDDPDAADAGLLGLAAALGRLGAHTWGREAEYDRVRDALGPRLPAGRRDPAQLPAAFAGLFADAGLEPQPGAAAEVAALAGMLATGSPFRAYSRGDRAWTTCVGTGRARPFDFEGGTIATRCSTACTGTCFPTCWCVGQLADRRVARMEQAYARSWRRAVRGADDDAFALPWYTCATGCSLPVRGLLGKLLQADETGARPLRQRRLTLGGVRAAGGAAGAPKRWAPRWRRWQRGCAVWARGVAGVSGAKRKDLPLSKTLDRFRATHKEAQFGHYPGSCRHMDDHRR
jgi:hypothetical protein